MKTTNMQHVTARSRPVAASPTSITHQLLLAVLVLAMGVVLFGPDAACGADNEVVDMIVELVRGADEDMRMLALQQIREEVPGADATRRFVELLPSVPVEVQVKLIDALGERGDAGARPAIVKMLDSQTGAVRIVAIRALSHLASPEDIATLAKLAATGSDAEKQAARDSLRQLQGAAMLDAMTESLKSVDARSKIELIAALVDRDVKASVPVMLQSAEDSDLAVRLAVLTALRAMGDESHTTLVVTRLKAAKDKSERRQAALALQALCKRGQARCAEPVIAGLKKADPSTRILLMRALPLAGGPKALNATVASLKAKDKAVRGEAVRLLAGWPDPSAIVHLKPLARDVEDLKTHVLAIRGMVRLASPAKGRPADLATLRAALKLASRKEEKGLVLGVLGTVPTPESLTLVAASLDEPTLAENAGLAAVRIAEKIGDAHKDQVQTVMRKVVETVRSEETQAKAQKLLDPS